MKCSTGTEVSVAFVGFEGRCHVFDLKCHPALMQEGGLRELFEDKEVTKVRTAQERTMVHSSKGIIIMNAVYRYETYSVFLRTSLNPDLK